VVPSTHPYSRPYTCRAWEALTWYVPSWLPCVEASCSSPTQLAKHYFSCCEAQMGSHCLCLNPNSSLGVQLQIQAKWNRYAASWRIGKYSPFPILAPICYMTIHQWCDGSTLEHHMESRNDQKV
jgi:hypothetical protein